MKKEIPIEYQKGETKFLNCRIDLSNRVFIPRIETEFWVGKAISEIKEENKGQKIKTNVLDIFSGSGCIGISLLKNIKNVLVDFVDIDKRALRQIRINLKLNEIKKERYRVCESDLFDKLEKKKYDYIFANPPYVSKERLNEVQKSVLKNEPKRAILGGRRGLYYIERFLKKARYFLKKRGAIYLEFDPLQKKEIEDILKKYKYSQFKFFRDQFKKYRFVRVS